MLAAAGLHRAVVRAATDGQLVVAVGNPLGLDGALSAGVVHDLNNYLTGLSASLQMLEAAERTFSAQGTGVLLRGVGRLPHGVDHGVAELASGRLDAVLVGGTLVAQVNTATVTGTVTDPSGAVIGNAPVELKNTETGQIYAGASTATGA